ncbi:MAG: hypothetical protein IKF90_20550 [Parasporobacterium sp.]|nr:hypothetical protein [Parasporobacterium sp.]
MQFAVDSNNCRVHIDEASLYQEFYCPFCGNPMIQRRGQINIPHFAHAKGYLCSDTWHYEEMTEWHMKWQNQYPKDCQEVVMEYEGVKHRADVCIGNSVIEFQHSPISPDDFQARNEFYTAAGFSVLWVFDVREAYQHNLTSNGEDASHYNWKYAPKTLKDFDLYGDVQIYFHLQDKGFGQVIRLISCRSGDLSSFQTHFKTIYYETQFVELSINGLKKENDISSRLIQNEFYSVRRSNGEKEYYGCPINEDSYAPMIREENRSACDSACPYFQGIDYDKKAVICIGSYHYHLGKIYVLLKHQKTGKFVSLQYLDQSGRLVKGRIHIDEVSPARTILDLAKEYNPQVMIVRHIESGTEFKILGDPLYMYNKYNHNIYGKMKRRNWGSFENKGRKIYYADEPYWIMEWFVSREADNRKTGEV